MRASRSCRGRRAGPEGLHRPTACPPLPRGAAPDPWRGEPGVFGFRHGSAGGFFSSQERLGASRLGWELGVEGPDVLIGDGQVGGSHARGVLRGEGTQLARPEPPRDPQPHPTRPHSTGEGRSLPLCINSQFICCAHGWGKVSPASPPAGISVRPQKNPSSPCPRRTMTFLQHRATGRGVARRALRKIISSLLFWTAKVLPQGSESRLN